MNKMSILTDEDIRKIVVQIHSHNIDCGKSNYTLSSWAEYWYHNFKKNQVSDTTKQNYVSCIKNHIMGSSISNKCISEITTVDLQSIVNYAYSVKNLTRTTKLLFDTLKQMFNRAFLLNEINKDVSLNLMLPKIQLNKRTPLNENEIKVFLSANNLNIHEKAFIYLALLAGLRRGEILALSKNDIDFTRKIIFVNKTIEFPKNIGRIKQSPKSKSGIRTIPIVPQLEEILIRLCTQQSSAHIFVDPATGQLFTKSKSYYFWKNIIKKINSYNTSCMNPLVLSKNITPHVLRHTYATALYYAKVGIKDAQYLLGHSSIEMTMDVYTHLKRHDDETTNNVINKLDDYLTEVLNN